MNEPSVSEPLVSAPLVNAPLCGRRILLTRAKPDDAIARALPPLLGLPPPSTRVVTIGAPTAATARGQGIVVAAQASSPTPEAIVRALIDALARPTHADAPEERNS